MKRCLHSVAFAFALLWPAMAHAQTIDLASGGWSQVWVGPEARAAAGTWLDQGAVGAGDVRRDLIIGAPGALAAPGSAAVVGRVFVLFGGLQPSSGTLSLNNAQTVLTGAHAGDGFGSSTAAGNIWNTEGSIPRALVVGAPNSGAGDAGKVYLFRGGFEVGDSLTPSDALVEIHGRSGDRLGSALATADLNNDGYREIVIGAPGNSRVYIINGGAAFNHSGPPIVINLATTPASLEISGSGIGAVLAGGEVTGDGIYDVAIGSPLHNRVYVIKGRTSATFPPTWNLNLSTTPADITLTGMTADDRLGASLRIMDLDANGRRELVMGAPGGDGPAESRVDAGEVYAVEGDRMMALAAAAPATLNVAAADIRFYGAAAGHATGTRFTAGDINRDSPDDIVIYAPGGSPAGAWLVYYGREMAAIGTLDANGIRIVDFAAAGQVDRRIIGDPAKGQASAAQVFEVTGEGARDITIGVPAAESGAGAVYFTISPNLTLSEDSVQVSLIVNAGQQFAYRIRVQNSSHIPMTWRTSVNQPWLSTDPTTGSSSAGNDGTFYVIASAGDRAPGTYTGIVTVTSTSRDLDMFRQISVTMQVAPASREPGDFSGDGGFDIVWQHDTQGWLSLWKMNGTTLISGVSLTPDRVADTNWKVVGTGDFNRDGHPDLLWHHRTQGWVSLWLMNGTRQVAGVALTPDRVADTNWQIVATGDFNGDGHRDILWQHSTDRLLSVWLMRGTTLLDGRLLTPNRVASNDWRIVGSGDFNADARADIVWHNQATGELSVWYMNGTTMIDGVRMAPARVADTNWKIRAVGDINRDGKPDLLWQHMANGSLAAWFMNGVNQISGTSLTPGSVSDLAWRIVGPR